MRVQEAIAASRLDTDGYQPRAQLFPTMEEAAASAPSQEDMVEAESFDEGNISASGKMKKIC